MPEQQIELTNLEQLEILDPIFEQFNQHRSVMIYLQHVQSELGYVPEYAIQYLSKRTNVSESHMFGVITDVEFLANFCF